MLTFSCFFVFLTHSGFLWQDGPILQPFIHVGA